jgi:hypothetical protein
MAADSKTGYGLENVTRFSGRPAFFGSLSIPLDFGHGCCCAASLLSLSSVGVVSFGAGTRRSEKGIETSTGLNAVFFVASF